MPSIIVNVKYIFVSFTNQYEILPCLRHRTAAYSGAEIELAPQCPIEKGL